MLGTTLNNDTKWLDMEREDEALRYVEAYSDPDYRIKGLRRGLTEDLIFHIPYRTSVLDVGCGRGEMLEEAGKLGFERLVGVEPYVTLCPYAVQSYAHNLPFEDNEFDLVMSWDVMEHLLPQDTESSLREMRRVAKKNVLLSVSNTPCKWHINIRSYDEWDELVREFVGGDVVRIPYTNQRAAFWKCSFT